MWFHSLAYDDMHLSEHKSWDYKVLLVSNEFPYEETKKQENISLNQ